MREAVNRAVLIAFALPLAILAGCHGKSPEADTGTGKAASNFGNRAAELDAAAANDSAAAEAQASRVQAAAVNAEIVASNQVVMPIEGNAPKAATKK